MTPRCAFVPAATAVIPNVSSYTRVSIRPSRAPPRRARYARMSTATPHRDTATTCASDDNDDDAWSPGASFMVPSDDGLTFSARANLLQHSKVLPESAVRTLLAWRTSYQTAAAANPAIGSTNASNFVEAAFETLMELMRRHVVDPIQFEPFHRRIVQPFDYYSFGMDFASALVDVAHSRVLGLDNLHSAQHFLSQGHNVVFLSNHQSEADPYAIDSLLTAVAHCPRSFARDLIFMAGDRVREDLVVVPFSAGRNLLTVYSKKHLDDVPKLRAAKVAHNRRTISVTQKMFAAGGVAVWFAPSGGRDRRSAHSGNVEVSPFDPSAIEMMRFTAAKSGKPCHFFPMSLLTYDMLPPPSNVGGAAVGEERVVNFIPLYMAISEEIDWRHAVPQSVSDKYEKRDACAKYIQTIVENNYALIGGYDF